MLSHLITLWEDASANSWDEVIKAVCINLSIKSKFWFWKCTSHALDVKFIFKRCCCSLTVATPDKYQRDIVQELDVFMILTNGSEWCEGRNCLCTPTPNANQHQITHFGVSNYWMVEEQSKSFHVFTEQITITFICKLCYMDPYMLAPHKWTKIWWLATAN